jgi:Holliday junction resolvase RusA-like endonuclease
VNVEQERDLREGFFTTTAPERGLFGRRRVEFTVIGVAAPQGSTKSFGFHLKDGSGRAVYGNNGEPMIRTVTTSDNPSVKEWRRLVADAAQRQIVQCEGFAIFTGAIAIDIVFALPRPRSLPKKVTAHTKKPDLDKLLRSTVDAMKGVVWSDDSQITEARIRKRYADPSAPASAHIAIEG